MIDSGDDADVICRWYDRGRVKASCPSGGGYTHILDKDGPNNTWQCDPAADCTWKRERARIAALEKDWEEHKKTRVDL